MASIISQFKQELIRNINIDHKITARSGNKINETEEFKVKFLIRNKSPYTATLTHLKVYDTPFARVVGQSSDNTDRPLPPRFNPFRLNTAVESMEFTMKAIQSFDEEDRFEKFARVKVNVQFDPKAVLAVSKMDDEYTNIWEAVDD